jgi:GNAT superfamily N-acetyltransferase
MPIREFVMADLHQVESVFRRSMMSVRPSYWKGVVVTISLYLLSYVWRFAGYLVWPSVFVQFLVHGGFYLFLRHYVETASPTKNFTRYTTDRSKLLVLTRPDTDQIVGFTSFEPMQDPTSCWVTYFFIDPDFQGQGLGLELNGAFLEYIYRKSQYARICGATSSWQTSQIKLQEKQREIFEERGTPIRLDLVAERSCCWMPIYQVNIIYTRL